MNRPAMGVVCVPSAKYYFVVKEDVKPSNIFAFTIFLIPTVFVQIRHQTEVRTLHVAENKHSFSIGV